jgi:hypothetical protein
MRAFASSLVFMTAVTVGVPAAFAQPEPRGAVSASIGVGSGSSDTGVAVGGALLFDVHERLSVEGQGIYLGRGKGADAFTAGGAVLINLLPASESIVPYAATGGGVYHVSFDLANPRFLGAVGGQFGAGTTVCPAPGRGLGFGPGFGAGTGGCSATGVGYWGVGTLPNFYARRLGPLVVPPSGGWETRTFTDPVVAIGGGVRFNVSERVMIRPDARALVVVGDGHTHTLGVFVVRVAPASCSATSRLA